MTPPTIRTDLFDPRQATEAIRVETLRSDAGPCEPSRTNRFGIVHVEHGQGNFWADAGQYRLANDTLLFFTPYQNVRFEPKSELLGTAIRFHANFLCVETFHAESGCAAALFNDPYHPPVVNLDPTAGPEIIDVVQRMRREATERSQAYEEMLLAQLKTLLILATRLKARSVPGCPSSPTGPRHPVLAELKELIESHYQTLHAPRDYAARLHMSAKTLGRVVREQLGKSLTDLIRERVMTHAKWQLLHTLKPVKQVAREVGFQDELYFSRVFKKATGFSPSGFRKFETEIRGGSNLSMPSPLSSIPPGAPTGKNRSG